MNRCGRDMGLIDDRIPEISTMVLTVNMTHKKGFEKCYMLMCYSFLLKYLFIYLFKQRFEGSLTKLKKNVQSKYKNYEYAHTINVSISDPI